MKKNKILKLVTFIVLIFFSTNGEAQTITPRIAEKIGKFCLYYQNFNSTWSYVCSNSLYNKYGIKSRQEVDKIYNSLATHRDMAGDIVLDIYRYCNSEDGFYLVIKDWFTMNEIEIIQNYCKQKLEQEQKAKREIERIEEEQKKQKIEEEARQRQSHIEKFLAERQQKIYSLDATQDLYKKNKEQIYSVIWNIVNKNGIKNASFILTNNCIVDYNGKNRHTIKIQGISDRLLESEIKRAVENIKFEALIVKEPYTQEDYAVTSESEYIIPYEVATKTEKLTLSKNSEGLNLIKGNELFFNNVKLSIARELKGKGKYKVEVTEFQNGNSTDIKTSISNYKKNNRFFMGISLSNITENVGPKLTIGITDINSSILGLYGSYGRYPNGTSSLKGELFGSEFLGGIVFSASNTIAFYGGLGVASDYEIIEIEKPKILFPRSNFSTGIEPEQHKSINLQSNFATELGIMLRIKYFYISSDWNYLMNNKQRFSIGCGVIF